MYTPKTLLYLLGAASTAITLGSCCYSEAGVSFADMHGRAIPKSIAKFCKGLPKNFAEGKRVTHCYAFPAADKKKHRIDMELANMERGNQGMSKEECRDQFSNIRNACSHGSEELIGGFWFRIDPNEGGC